LTALLGTCLIAEAWVAAALAVRITNNLRSVGVH
jgi:hypothetical protein